MCGVGEQVRKKQQRLLKNMDAHKVMLDLLQIPYEKVGGQEPAGFKVHGARGGNMGTSCIAGFCSLFITNPKCLSSLPFLRVMPR